MMTFHSAYLHHMPPKLIKVATYCFVATSNETEIDKWIESLLNSNNTHGFLARGWSHETSLADSKLRDQTSPDKA